MKRSISLILAIAVMFCFCMTPVFADDEATETTTTTPTATLTASLSGDTEPQAGEVFTVSFDFTDVSTNLFKSAQVAFSWPADVATLYDVEYAETITSDSSAKYAVTVNNVSLGRSDKFSSISTWDVANGKGDFTVYIDPDASDTSSVELTDGTWHFIDVAFMLGEDQSYEDFSLSITNVIAYFTEKGLDIESNTTNGTITTKGISASGALKEVTVDGVTYDVVSDNAVPYGGFEDEDGNFTMGTWQSPSGSGYFDDISSGYFYAVDKATDEAELYVAADGVTLESDDYALGSRWNDGATGLCSLANFIAVEEGKTYYVTFEYKHQTSGDFGYSVTSFTTTNEDFTDGTKLGTPADATTEWQTAEFVFTAESDGYVYFHFRWLGDGNNTGSGPYWYYDNFGVYEIAAQGETETPSEEESETEAPSEDESETEAPSEDESETEAPSEDESETEAPSEEETIEGAYYGVNGQPGVDADDNGIYDLPQEITGAATVTFKGAVLVDANNTLIAINNSENMTNNAYFSGSSVMLLVNAGGALSYRNGSSTVASGVSLTIGEEYDFTYEIDVESATWGVTIADADGNVVFTISDLAFRTTTDTLDSIVLANNSGYDKTVYVRDIVVTVEEEPSETPSEDESETEAPSEDESETEAPSEDESETEAPSEEETDEPTEETTIPEDAYVSETGQVEDAIHELETAITTTGTVSFTLVANSDEANDTLIAITNADAVLSNSNYYANAGVQLMVSGTTLSARIDGSAQEIGTLVSGEAYDVVVTVDVEAQTWSAVVTDSEGNEVASVENAAFRCESELASIDSIVILDNKGGVESAYVYSVAVETESEGGDEEEALPVTVDASTYAFDTANNTLYFMPVLADGAETPEGDIVYIVSFTKDGKPALAIAATATLGTGVGMSGLVDYDGVAAISFVTGVDANDLLPITADSELGTPVGVYYPAE